MSKYADAIAEHVEEVTAARATAPMHIGPSSPMTDQNTLSTIVWADLTGQEARPMGRADAMSIPPLARQRHIICGTLARCPLVTLRGAERITPSESHWTTRTDGTMHPYHRMLWTADDLVFHGWSLWSATRGYAAAGQRGPLLSADRIEWDRWEVDDDYNLLVDEHTVREDEVILIPGPHEGILNFGAPALRRTLDNLSAVASAARNPSSIVNLRYMGDDQMTEAQIDATTERWAKARRGLNGGVSWTNKWIEVQELGTHEGHLLIDARNADAVDMSRLVSSPAAMADATSAGASLTYETTEGRNQQLIDYGVGLYMDAIKARLSMDDIVPKGERTAFDLTELTGLTPSPTGPNTDD